MHARASLRATSLLLLLVRMRMRARGDARSAAMRAGVRRASAVLALHDRAMRYSAHRELFAPYAVQLRASERLCSLYGKLKINLVISRYISESLSV